MERRYQDKWKALVLADYCWERGKKNPRSTLLTKKKTLNIFWLYSYLMHLQNLLKTRVHEKWKLRSGLQTDLSQ